MIRSLRFCSRNDAENMIGREGYAIISIFDSGVGPVALNGLWGAKLSIQFDDLEYDDPMYIAFDDCHADLILKFVFSLPKYIDILYVQCTHGISRSAAVALCISDILKLQRPDNAEFYNRMVYKVLLRRSLLNNWY